MQMTTYSVNGRLVLAGKKTRVKERFIVARTKKKKISLENLSKWEKKVVQKIKWFSLEEIKNCLDVIFPVLLEKYLLDIILGHYPKKPIKIDLGKQPVR